jgi:hypothetical protein
VAVASELEQLVETIENFTSWSHGEKLKFFAWYIHSQKGHDRFDPTSLRGCYDEVGIEKPSNVNPYIATLEKKKPKEVLRDGRGLYLPKHIKDDFEMRYGQRESTLQVTRLLIDLPQQVPDLAQRTFLDEALICFRYGAFRAAVVMGWNLAFHHLCDFVLRKKLTEFNQRWLQNYPGHHKNAQKHIVKIEDFADDLKESEVITICASARIITGDLQKVLNIGLQRRNVAAHPSNATITSLQAEAHIEDLVINFVLKLK